MRLSEMLTAIREYPALKIKYEAMREQQAAQERTAVQLSIAYNNLQIGIHVEDNEAGGQTVIIDGGNARDFDEYVQGKVKKYVDGRIASDDEVNEMLQNI